MKTLTLPLKAIYFNQILEGSKQEEFRLCTPYWEKRLVGKQYDRLVLTLGYPGRADAQRRIVRPWRGYEIRTISHPHFGPEPVRVFAIPVQADGPSLQTKDPC
jgi:hypothetical protein